MKYNRVVIIGSSIAGMVTAKIFSQHVDQVYVLERNKLSELTSPSSPRKGVPQGRHVHLLLSKGSEIVNEVYPETRQRLDELGGSQLDLGDLFWYQSGNWKSTANTNIITSAQARPTLDWVVYQQLKEVKNVKIIEDVTVNNLVYDKNTNTIQGVTYQFASLDHETTLLADLVIDCSGRGSRTEKWFEELEIGCVDKDEVPVDVKYVSRYFELPNDSENFHNIMVYPDAPNTSRMGFIFKAEDKIIVTLSGMLGDHAPMDEQGYLDFAAGLDHPILYRVLKELTPISDFMSFSYPASRRKYYNKMNNFPNSYLVMGDAYTSFNPIYGQGMTSACLQAYAIKMILEKSQGNYDLKKLYKEFYKKSFVTIDTAWTFSTAEDLRFPSINAKRPALLKILHPFSKMIIDNSHNSYIYAEFLKVLNFESGMFALFKPKFLYQLLKTKFFGPKNMLEPGILDYIEEMIEGIQNEAQPEFQELLAD